ncbi:hypothetical protein HL033_04475 [Neoehrlichia mikurensis]|uniref:Uncharacterized protein n=1 Tax=Neoehrlichia mikurensis TaxID=89586 RepID=A0A9Q9F3G6_9RICK|nr:hypothetical protein [Neoehrlichia mikurensis]QXK91967.1 hypothetical protein IAH97_04475 [Neoehrlichia mikurensis]QXK93181.1 hypothetical protein HUN61_04470 [Neoehrlichia mikurensis]QXK93659.1 hypothetical protein HL033_04475 [Neoehrlichia mikurensis]UTO55384.1 hypothetical protein LUA82_04380 [Neoehrlichia mikurensis]UTO56303.1 hypothetical protein LUA81_04330 [Neoehrlichia mikurensis]
MYIYLNYYYSCLYNQKRILPCAAYLTGECGVYDLFTEIPVVIGKITLKKS